MDPERLLDEVILQARALGIPVSRQIRPEVRLNARAVARFGCCIASEGEFVIELSARLIPAGESAVRETLAHEVLHTCRGCRDHGARWKSYAARMNEAYGYHISRTGSWEGLGLEDQKPVNHLLTCERCGQEFKRAKASRLVRYPDRYRCKCGGKLILQY